MSFIQREIDRTTAILQLDVPKTDAEIKRYDQAYLVQQALVWALDPTGYRSPVDMIDNAPVLNGNRAPV